MKQEYRLAAAAPVVTINGEIMDNLFIEIEIFTADGEYLDRLTIGYTSEDPEAPYYPISNFLKSDFTLKLKSGKVPTAVLGSWRLRKQIAEIIDASSPEISLLIKQAAQKKLRVTKG